MSTIVKARRARHTLLTVLQAIWLLAVGAAIEALLVRNWDSIMGLESSPRTWALMALAGAAAMSQRLAGGLRWTWVVNCFTARDEKLPTTVCLRAFFLSNLGMYLPGTYWFIPMRMALVHKSGISPMQSGLGIVVEQFMLIISGALVSLIGLNLVARATERPIHNYWWGLIVVAVGFGLIHPRCVRGLTRHLARLSGRKTVDVALSYGDALGLLFWSVFVWLLAGASLLCLTAIFRSGLSVKDLWLSASIFATAWLVGFFTPFAPSGIGVREGVMALAFASLGTPAVIGVLVSVLSRIVLLTADIVWAAVYGFSGNRARAAPHSIFPGGR